VVEEYVAEDVVKVVVEEDVVEEDVVAVYNSKQCPILHHLHRHHGCRRHHLRWR
jgi:hypothetical protein